MNVADGIALTTAAGAAIGSGVLLAARIIVAVLREILASLRAQTEVQRGMQEAIGDLRAELVSLHSRVDVFVGMAQRDHKLMSRKKNSI